MTTEQAEEEPKQHKEREPRASAAMRTLRAIADYVDGHGWAPSYREIAAATGYRAISGVRGVLHSLEQAGYLRLGTGPRTIAVTPEGMEALRDEG